MQFELYGSGFDLRPRLLLAVQLWASSTFSKFSFCGVLKGINTKVHIRVWHEANDSFLPFYPFDWSLDVWKWWWRSFLKIKAVCEHRALILFRLRSGWQAPARAFGEPEKAAEGLFPFSGSLSSRMRDTGKVAFDWWVGTRGRYIWNDSDGYSGGGVCGCTLLWGLRSLGNPLSCWNLFSENWSVSIVVVQ